MLYKPAIRMVPEPLWNQNLRHLLSKNRWTKIRQALIAERGLVCETCEKAVTESRKIFAHEEWEYDTSRKPAVAHLKRLVLSCWHCHAVEHFGRTVNMVRSSEIGDQAVEDTIAHFCRLNKVGRKEFQAHLADAKAEWTRLSKLKWVVDLGDFNSLVAG